MASSCELRQAAHDSRSVEPALNLPDHSGAAHAQPPDGDDGVRRVRLLHG
jgi:hypothetical protein